MDVSVWSNFNPYDVTHLLIEGKTINNFRIVICIEYIDIVSGTEIELSIVRVLGRMEVRDIDFVKESDWV